MAALSKIMRASHNSHSRFCTSLYFAKPPRYINIASTLNAGMVMSSRAPLHSCKTITLCFSISALLSASRTMQSETSFFAPKFSAEPAGVSEALGVEDAHTHKEGTEAFAPAPLKLSEVVVS